MNRRAEGTDDWQNRTGLVGSHGEFPLQDFRVINKGGTAITVALCNYKNMVMRGIFYPSDQTGGYDEQRTCKNL